MGTKRFILNTWHDGKTIVTAEGLLDRIKRDSKSNYNWIASATDLVHVCKMKGFPEYIASEIEDIILNCFAELAIKSLYSGSNQKDTDERAVWYCYYNSKNEELKDIFVKQNIRRAILLNYGDAGELLHSGPKHNEFEKRFIDRMTNEIRRKDRYVYDEKSEKNLISEYIAWRKSLCERYSKEYKEADESGYFGEERKGPFRGDSTAGAMKYFKLVNADFHEVTLNE